jgi:energy-coupling factor transporter transmembrane protein EcfT
MENKTSSWTLAAVTAVWYAICSFGNFFARTMYQLKLSEDAVNQLDNSDAAYLQFQVLNHLNHIQSFVALLFTLGCVFIWRDKLKKLSAKAPSVGVAIALIFFALTFTSSAHAYYDKTDRAEWVNIEANQSAFLIPAVGANKTSQKQFGSIEYLMDNKVAAKRVQIPHVVAPNTALMSDYYVPGATLYLVDRTPYTREWVNASDRGTSTKKEGFHFESADSINLRTGVIISASVSEEDAAKFFYWFGTAAIQNSQKPEDVFASVKYGKSLADVMDTVVRAKVQQVLAKEFAKRTFVKGIGDKAAIMDLVEQTVKDEFQKKGITIAFVGFAEELSFDPRIQKALDDSVIASVQYANKDALMAVIEINRKTAEIGIINAQAATMQKWNGVVNFPFFMPDSWAQALSGLIKK